MPRFINDLDVFYDPSQQHAFSPAFDEALSPVITDVQTASGSTDTSAIDGFTQGVELTTLHRHDAGIAKIWSGQAGHELLVTWYGERGPAIDHSYADDASNVITDARAFVAASPRYPTVTFPIVASSGSQGPAIRYRTTRVARRSGAVSYRLTQDTLATIMNGVIEPIAIRLKPSFFSNDVPIDVHQVVGVGGNGNVDGLGASDRVMTVDAYSVALKQPGFVDADANVNRYQFTKVGLTTVTSSVQSLGFSPDLHVAPAAHLAPFADARLVRNVGAPASEDALLLAALSPMSGSTDTYVSFDERSATCGWSYDGNVALGTDSLAFGGMVH